MAALQVVIEEAGGRFTSIDGQPRADRGSGVSSNGILHDACSRPCDDKRTGDGRAHCGSAIAASGKLIRNQARAILDCIAAKHSSSIGRRPRSRRSSGRSFRTF
jgi:hypothetical protein